MVDIDHTQEDAFFGGLTPDEEDEREWTLEQLGTDIHSYGSVDPNPTHTVGPNPPDEAEKFPNRLDNEVSGRPR